MSGELGLVRNAALWAVGVVLGLLAISYALRAFGVDTSAVKAPEDLVTQVTG